MRNKLAELTLAEGVQEIENSAFAGCTLLTSVEIPSSVTKIDGWAFYNTGLSSVTFSDAATGVLDIGDAFERCTGLTSVTLSKSVKSLAGTFEDCTGLTTVTFAEGLESVGTNAFKGCTGLTAVTLPDSVTSLGASAFEGCSGLASVTIGAGVETIDGTAFTSCNQLAAITVAAGNSNYASDDGILYTADYSGIKLMPPAKSGKMTIGPKVTTIAKDVLGSNTKINSIEFAERNAEDGLELTIGEAAFNGKTNITSVTFPQTGEITIGKQAFKGCTGIKNLEITSGVKQILAQAFQNCTGIQTVRIASSVTTLQYGIFYHESGKTSQMTEAYVAAENEYGSIPSEMFAGCGNLKKVTFTSNKIKKVSSDAFRSCLSIQEINLPASCVNLDSGSADAILPHSTNATTVTVSGIVPKNMFYKNTDLVNAVIEDGVESIGENAFFGCTNLATVTIPKSIKQIDGNAFKSSTPLKFFTVNYDGTWEKWYGAEGIPKYLYAPFMVKCSDGNVLNISTSNWKWPSDEELAEVKAIVITNAGTLSKSQLAKCTSLEKLYYSGEYTCNGHGYADIAKAFEEKYENLTD